MLFRANDFGAINGFDEKFFLYYEDVDICTRLWKANKRIELVLQASVIHKAQHMSHRNLRYLLWHLTSMVRYFLKHWLRFPRARL